MGQLTDLPNIGTVMEAQLNEVGISSFEALKQAGSRETWLRIAAIDPSACYMRLCALEGAIEGVRWHGLPEGTKKALKAFYNEHKPG
jgi:DNA transformation protein